jgi:hypothetical protein
LILFSANGLTTSTKPSKALPVEHTLGVVLRKMASEYVGGLATWSLNKEKKMAHSDISNEFKRCTKREYLESTCDSVENKTKVKIRKRKKKSSVFYLN